MEQTKRLAPVKGREVLSKLGGTDNTTKTTYKSKQWLGAKNRLLILEQISERWAAKGLYRNQSVAMAALLGVSE